MTQRENMRTAIRNSHRTRNQNQPVSTQQHKFAGITSWLSPARLCPEASQQHLPCSRSQAEDDSTSHKGTGIFHTLVLTVLFSMLFTVQPVDSFNTQSSHQEFCFSDISCHYCTQTLESVTRSWAEFTSGLNQHLAHIHQSIYRILCTGAMLT